MPRLNRTARANQRVQHYESFLDKASSGVRNLSFSLDPALIFFFSWRFYPPSGC